MTNRAGRIQVSDEAMLARVTDAYWRNHAFRFGAIEFRPETGEIFQDGRKLAQLSEAEAETLAILIRIYPLPAPRKWVVQQMRQIGCYWHIDTVKVVISRIRAKIGVEIIETHPRGYRFQPEFWVARRETAAAAWTAPGAASAS